MTKSILITGSSRGIGKAIALYLAKEKFQKENYEIVVHYYKQELAAKEVLQTIIDQGGKGRILQFDISNFEECKTKIEADIEKNGSYFGVVCNAGIAADNPFPMISETDWNKVISTNLNGFYNVLQQVVMPMVQARKPARIITLSSISGITGNRGQVNYSAAKAGIIGATKALALELAKRKITVNCIAPGIIETDMTSELPAEEITKMIPLRRFGKPEEVASLAAYLLSDDAAYITKQVISINGGIE
ncbi:MAG: 3-oxoacyl-[acyl-carrier protein] reductase [Rickettsiales bacterium]|jgi:3-oxoacyl-[acyl-carrier protein] reductase